MINTIHVQQRMSQRGISKQMLKTVMDFGEQKNDRFKLNRKGAYKAIAKLQEDIKWLLKIADKGGVTVVASGETLITAWNNH